MTTATISKRFDFSASHYLEGLEEDHPCARMHGHNYEVLVELTGHTDDTGFVIDYRRLAPFKAWLDETVEHRTLNDRMDVNPTAENIAAWFLSVVHDLLWETAPDGMRRVSLLAVSVSETPKTNCTVQTRPDPFQAAEHQEQLDVHDLDAERYRWNFDLDGDVHRDEDLAAEAADAAHTVTPTEAHSPEEVAARLLRKAQENPGTEPGR